MPSSAMPSLLVHFTTRTAPKSIRAVVTSASVVMRERPFADGTATLVPCSGSPTADGDLIRRARDVGRNGQSDDAARPANDTRS